MKNLKSIVLAMVILGVIFTGTACGQQASNVPSPTTQPVTQPTAQPTTPPVIDPAKEVGPKVEFTMADGGKMVFKLLPKYAPKTVDNFVKLINEKFFDGLKFHRIYKGFMVQSGKGSTGVNKPTPDSVFGEFSQNGFPQNTITHQKGVISMAKSQDPNSASSEFFIVTADASFLDGGYAAFGMMISGTDTLNTIENTKTVENPDMPGETSLPTKDVIIKSVRVIK